MCKNLFGKLIVSKKSRFNLYIEVKSFTKLSSKKSINKILILQKIISFVEQAKQPVISNVNKKCIVFNPLDFLEEKIA